MFKTITKTKTLYVADDKIEELKASIRVFYEPNSWADQYTRRAFEAKWHMTLAEAESLVGHPVWTESWVAP